MQGEDHRDLLLLVGLSGAVAISPDHGATWNDVTGPWKRRAVLRAEAGSGGESRTVLRVLSVQANDMGHYVVELWESPDLGASWQDVVQFTTEVPAVMTAWPADPAQATYFMATQHRVIKLHRLNGEWAVQQHLFDGATRVTALTASPDFAVDGTVCAATSQGLARSQDRGETWSLVAGLPDGLPVTWMGLRGGTLSAVTLGGEVWRIQEA